MLKTEKRTVNSIKVKKVILCTFCAVFQNNLFIKFAEHWHSITSDYMVTLYGNPGNFLFFHHKKSGLLPTVIYATFFTDILLSFSVK